MLIFSMPRSGSSAFAEKLALENELVNNKEFFNVKVSGFHPYLGTYMIEGLNKINITGETIKIDSIDLSNKLPKDYKERIKILKNSPLDIDEYVVKILPHHVSWISKELIDLFKNTHTYILNRRDTLRQFLSWYFANTTKRFHNRVSFGEGFRSHRALTEAYNNQFPDGVIITEEWFERFSGLFQKYIYGSLVIKNFFNKIEMINYEDIYYPDNLGNKKIDIDYNDWVNNLDEVKAFTNQINTYKEKII